MPLVTGGGSGIGYGLVKQFLALGCPKVIITGRTEARLQVRALNAFFFLPNLAFVAAVAITRLLYVSYAWFGRSVHPRWRCMGAARAHSLARCAS